MRLSLIPLFFQIILLALTTAALGATVEGAPVHIEADRMESSQQANEVIFTGNVEARQGDLFIKADHMIVKYDKDENRPQDGPQTGKIAAIIARGHVVISREDWTASGDALDYSTHDKKAILNGNTKVQQKNNLITGERIVLYLDQGKSIIEKSGKEGGRVKAFFYPDEDKKTTTPAKR